MGTRAVCGARGGGGALRAPARRQAQGLPAGWFSRVRAGGPHPGKLPPPPGPRKPLQKGPLSQRKEQGPKAG